MIDKLLRKFGYIRESEVDINYHLKKLAESIGDPTEYVIEKEHEENFFNDLSRVDQASDFLKATMAKDMQRYFAAPQEQQELIRGAFTRTSYFYSRLKKANEPHKVEPDKKPKRKLEGSRYA